MRDSILNRLGIGGVAEHLFAPGVRTYLKTADTALDITFDIIRTAYAEDPEETMDIIGSSDPNFRKIQRLATIAMESKSESESESDPAWASSSTSASSDSSVPASGSEPTSEPDSDRQSNADSEADADDPEIKITDETVCNYCGETIEALERDGVPAGTRGHDESCSWYRGAVKREGSEVGGPCDDCSYNGRFAGVPGNHHDTGCPKHHESEPPMDDIHGFDRDVIEAYAETGDVEAAAQKVGASPYAAKRILDEHHPEWDSEDA